MKSEDATKTKSVDVGNPSKTTDPNVPNEKIPETEGNILISPEDGATYLKSVHFRAILVGVRFPTF